MSDLVERLRCPWTDYYTVKNGKMTGLLTEAADEIERLRKEVDDLEAQLEALADSSPGEDGEP